MFCAGACAWFSLALVLLECGTLGSAAVDNRCDRQRGCTLWGGGVSTLGGVIFLCICVWTLGGGAGLYAGGCAGGIGLLYSCPSVSCISCVITFGYRRGAGLLVECVGGGGGAVWFKISWRRSNAWIYDSWRCGGILPSRNDVRFAAAAMMEYSGVETRLVIYLCLKKTLPDILGVHVSFTHQHINRCDRQRGCTLWGGGVSTLGGVIFLCIGVWTLGGGAGLYAGGCAGGIGLLYSCPSVSCISCVIIFGYRRGAGLLVECVGCGGGAVWFKISWRRSNAWIYDSWRCGVILPSRDDVRFAAAAMMEYSGVEMRLVIYLCLKKNLPDILGVHVSFTHSCQHR